MCLCMYLQDGTHTKVIDFLAHFGKYFYDDGTKQLVFATDWLVFYLIRVNHVLLTFFWEEI